MRFVLKMRYHPFSHEKAIRDFNKRSKDKSGFNSKGVSPNDKII